MSLERADDRAFRGRFDAAVREARKLEPSQAALIRAYVDAARGRFARAERALDALLSSGASGPATRARAAATLGSVLRQTGRHAEARDVERAALRRAPTPGLRAHLLIGLVADAVGLGDLRAVDAAVRRIGARPAGGWRAAVRLRWVRCERELLAGRSAAAASHARRAVEIARRADATRHEAKSLLFLGAALAEAASHDPGSKKAVRQAREAERALHRSRALAQRVGAAPIAAVAGELLSALGARR